MQESSFGSHWCLEGDLVTDVKRGCSWGTVTSDTTHSTNFSADPRLRKIVLPETAEPGDSFVLCVEEE